MDTLTPGERSKQMARVRSTGTVPELAVRKLLAELGVRYRVHVATLPGRPDIVLASRRAVIFVHGCFWHRHRAARCTRARVPSSRKGYWLPKLSRNEARDRRNQAELKALSWRRMVVWECQLRTPDRVRERIRRFLLL